MSDEYTTPDLADVFHRLDKAMNKNDIDEVMSFFAPMPSGTPHWG
jgi:hypothetical protein